MKPRRTAASNTVLELAGGTEDNRLHATIGTGLPGLADDDPGRDEPYIACIFEPDQAERAAIASGANVELVIFGQQMPPVSLATTREQPLSRPQRTIDGPAIWAELPAELVEHLCAVLDGVPLSERDHRDAGVLELATQLRAGLEALEA